MSRRSFALLLALPALAFAPRASAQSFNVDVGTNISAPLPSSSYGAGANQPGFWTGFSTNAGGLIPLKDLVTNAPTTVTMQSVGGWGDFFFNLQGWTGDDAALMNDATDVSNVAVTPNGGLITWTITGLAAGNYKIYTYSIAPDDPLTNSTVIDVPGSPQGPTSIGFAPWSGSPHVQGVTYTLHTITITAGQTITVLTSNTTTNPAGNYGTVNGFQIVKGPDAPGTAVCFGDGTGTACPCANNSVVGNKEGCLNSLTLGGKLVASGNASTTGDTLLLSGSQVPNGPGLYFQGTTQIGGGAGVVFGDGLRCAGGSIIRLGIVSASGNASTYPSGATPPNNVPIATKGFVVPGDTRTYQLWYRDSATFCTASVFNLTNAWSLTWL